MFVIIGFAIVFGSVIGGFLMEHGPIAALLQYIEFLIIGGAALGSLLVSTPPKLLSVIIKRVIGTLGGDKYSKKSYIELLKMLYELFQVAKKDGLMGIEPHIEKPKDSAIFKKNKSFLSNHHAVDFLCDSLRMLVSGGISPYDLESLMDSDLITHHEETAKPATQVQTVADALPGFGIVAAVLGVVLTMQKIGGPPEEIGKLVGAALVGTFLGVLLAYGVAGPIATNITLQNASEARYFEAIKACVVAFSKGSAPLLAVESGRRVIYSSDRPTFFELEKVLRGGKEGGS
jgi:chemotaxis protein MotA